MQKMIQVNVTKLDIQRGVQGNASTCPVARAIRRTIKLKRANSKDQSVSVRQSGVVIYKGAMQYGFNDRTSKKRPYSLQGFVQKFDSGEEVKPTKFFLVQS